MDIVALSGRPKDKLIQLALDRGKAKLDKLTYPRLVSEKIDGVFCLAVKDVERTSISVGQVVRIFSRTGEEYTSMNHIASLLNDLMDVGDIIIFEACGPMGTPQSTVSGWARDTKEQHPELMAACHDHLTVDEFINGGGRPYGTRLRDLSNIVAVRERTKGTYWTIFKIAQKLVFSFEEALEYAEQVWANGGEGAVLRNPEGTYQGGKRNADILKIKQGASFDLEVVDIYPGQGKYKNTLGGLVCRWKNDRVIDISGMTDEQRILWWSIPSKIIGKVVQVDAMCESSKGLLREPRFKGIRHDKTKGDF